MKPPGSTGALVSHGNATTPFVGAPFAIEHRIGIGAPTIGAPSLTTVPRMPFIEKITPRTVNAGKTINVAQARGLAIATRAMQRGVDTVTGYGNTFFQRIGTPLRSVGPKLRRTNNSNYAQQ